MQVTAPVAGTEAEAWETLTAALGVKGVSVGQRWTTPAGVSPLGGVVEYVTESPYDALLRLDKPGPGIAALGAVTSRWPEHGGDELFYYGDQAAETVARRRRCGRRGSRNASRCRRSRARRTPDEGPTSFSPPRLLPAAALAARGDKPGCADHPLFPTRLPDYKITRCKVTEYDSVQFLKMKQPATHGGGKVTYLFLSAAEPGGRGAPDRAQLPERLSRKPAPRSSTSTSATSSTARSCRTAARSGAKSRGAAGYMNPGSSSLRRRR